MRREVLWASTHGRRTVDVFSPEFKRTTAQRVLTGEKTVAELSRELDIAPNVIRNWSRHSEAGATTAVAANEEVVRISQLRETSNGRFCAMLSDAGAPE